ncbi:restriction endonuclease subunit S [Undibacterium sp. Tian12W]|uniref:restriction endonuclease subunit S n=1 Tax=Undibacterium sp. Tian12W TaxID=3413054 RepID=UPI003BF3CB21
MKWVSLKLGEVIDIKHGYAFKSEFFTDSGLYILLSPGNCHEEGGLKLKGDKEKFYSGEFPPEYLMSEGDMLVVMTDLINTAPILGGAFMIPENNRFLHNQRLGLVQITDVMRIDKGFLYYLLNSHNYRAQVRGSASGATVRHTAPTRIKECVVRVPRDVSYQKKVGSILSFYDAIIENNRRRIALLEESARLLYREWFVHLRFPGHEHTHIIDGVPKGWERVALESTLVLQRGFDLPTQSREEGTVPIYGSTGILGYHNKAKACAPGIVTGRSGTLGEVQYVDEDYWPLNTTLWIKEFKRVSPFFALFLLRELDLKQFNGGSSVPTLDRKTVHRQNVLIPSPVLGRAFDEFALPIFAQIKNITSQSEKLRTARDLLLPRLLSGELAV